MSSTQEAINRARCAEALDIWGEKAREYERGPHKQHDIRIALD